MAGECEVQMGSASVPCADGRISQATAGGRDGAAIACDDGEGSMRGAKWEGWCDHSAGVGGVCKASTRAANSVLFVGSLICFTKVVGVT